jgi:hypothetical protein
MEGLKNRSMLMPIRPSDTVDAHMETGDRDKHGHSGSRRYIAAAVIIGIALFVAGFAITLVSLPEDDTVSIKDGDTGGAYARELSSPSGGSALLLLGLIASMVGLVLATVIPAVLFIRHSHGDA